MTDIFDNFDDINLEFDDTKKKEETVDSELNLDDLDSEKKEELDLSEIPEGKASEKDTLEETIVSDPSTAKNKQEELQNLPIEKPVEVDPLADLDIELDDKPVETKSEDKPKKEKGKRGPKKKVVEKTPEQEIDSLIDELGELDAMLDGEKKPEEKKEESTTTVQDEGEEIEQEKPLENRKIYLDPELNIEFLEKSTYQTRSVARSQEEIAELATLIRRQGQLEPIHVVIKNGVKYLVAGFGRVAALMYLKLKTAKALIYENITEDEILKISSGTNTGRLELREWDKISSVGIYSVKNPTVDIKKLPQVFGFEKTAIYDYITIYNFFKGRSEFIEFFNKTPIPQFMFKALMKHMREFPQIDSKKVLEFVETALNYEKTTATKFNYELVELISGEKSRMESLEKEKNFDKLEIEGDGIEVSGGKEVVSQNLKDAVVKHKSESAATSDIAIARCMSIVKSLENICNEVNEIMKIQDFKKVIPSQTISILSKKLSETQVKITSLV